MTKRIIFKGTIGEFEELAKSRGFISQERFEEFIRLLKEKFKDKERFYTLNFIYEKIDKLAGDLK